jgi:hypothetical protein
MCDVTISDPDLQEIHTEVIAGIAGHLRDAAADLEDLYQCLRKEPPKPTADVTPIRKRAPADAEPEHAT